jgi:hypothetical protein
MSSFLPLGPDGWGQIVDEREVPDSQSSPPDSVNVCTQQPNASVTASKVGKAPSFTTLRPGVRGQSSWMRLSASWVRLSAKVRGL